LPVEVEFFLAFWILFKGLEDQMVEESPRFPFSDVGAGNPFVFPLLNAPKYWGKISEAVCSKKSGKSRRTAL
jgi:hypothetical protein